MRRVADDDLVACPCGCGAEFVRMVAAGPALRLGRAHRLDTVRAILADGASGRL